MKEVMAIDNIMEERGSTYGDFGNQAMCAQTLKQILHGHAHRHNVSLSVEQKEAIDMLATKLSRIVNGNPNKVDSWRDIEGYAKLIADRLEKHAVAVAGEVSLAAVESAAEASVGRFSGLEDAFDVVDGPK